MNRLALLTGDCFTCQLGESDHRLASSVASINLFADTRCGGGHGRGEQRGAVRSVELPVSGRRRAELQRRRHGHHPAETRRLRLVVGLTVWKGGFRPKQLLWGEEEKPQG